MAKAARRHANDMVDRHYFSHYSPAGSDVADRARRTGYAKRNCAWRLGEVLAWGVEGRSTAAATVAAWLDSPDHRRILVSNRYSDLGVGTVAGTPEQAFPHGLTAAAVLGRRHCSTSRTDHIVRQAMRAQARATSGARTRRRARAAA